MNVTAASRNGVAHKKPASKVALGFTGNPVGFSFVPVCMYDKSRFVVGKDARKREPLFMVSLLNVFLSWHGVIRPV